LGGFAPNLDVRETQQGLEIAAELPGMSERFCQLSRQT
jgi:HSP20 family molecular chaperone IbpA